jgi:hypothetical protein
MSKKTSSFIKTPQIALLHIYKVAAILSSFHSPFHIPETTIADPPADTAECSGILGCAVLWSQIDDKTARNLKSSTFHTLSSSYVRDLKALPIDLFPIKMRNRRCCFKGSLRWLGRISIYTLREKLLEIVMLCHAR